MDEMECMGRSGGGLVGFRLSEGYARACIIAAGTHQVSRKENDTERGVVIISHGLFLSRQQMVHTGKPPTGTISLRGPKGKETARGAE